MKKVVTITLSALAMFTLSALWNIFVVRHIVTAMIPNLKENPSIPMVALGYLVLACFMVYFYPKFKFNGSHTLRGFKFGALIGLFWILPLNIILHGAYNFPEIALIIDPLWAIVEQGVGGIVIALLSSKK